MSSPTIEPNLIRSKTDNEREVFKSFAAVAPISIDVSSIENKHPPEPDIGCRLMDGRAIGFELTKLIDEGLMKRRPMQSNTEEALRDYFNKSLPTDMRKRFQDLYGNAILRFDFAPGANLGARRKTFPHAFDRLLSEPEANSNFTVKNDPTILPNLQSIYVRKSRINGPIFRVGAFGWLGDPTEEAISKKLMKKYDCNYPIELIAYIDWDLLPAEGAWIAAANRAAGALAHSQFRRIWVFHCEKNEIVYKHP